jgi:hypothetical protein
MLSFEQAKTEVSFQVLPEFLKTVTQFQNRESAQAPTVEFINKIAELLLLGSVTYNQPQDQKKLEESKEPNNQKKAEPSFVQQVTDQATKYQEARDLAEADLNSSNTFLDEQLKNLEQMSGGNQKSQSSIVLKMQSDWS